MHSLLKRDNYYNKYLKYKNKYLKLKGSGILSITIDEIEFTLIAKNTKNERNNILILSKKDDIINYFLVYKSNSEIGIWRFHSLTEEVRPSNIQIYKGDDYVTETFININLQKYINENFHLIPESDKVVTRDDDFEKNFLLYSYNNHKSLVIKILEKSQAIKQKKIIALNTAYNSNFKKAIFSMNQNFIPIYNTFYKKNEEIINCLKQRYKSYDYFEILKFIPCGSEYITTKPFISQLYKESIKTGNEIMKKTIEKIVPDIETNTNPDKQVSKYYQILNLYLKNIGLVYDESTITFLYAYKTIFPNKDPSINNIFIINVYSIVVSVNEDKFILYFIKYKYTKIVKGETIIGEYNSILNIVPITSKITLCGLNSEVLSIGVYICKIAEYHKQLIYDFVDFDESKKRFLNDQYGFVGDYTNNLYPISEFYTKLPAIIDVKEKENTTEKYVTEIDSMYYIDKMSIYNDINFIEPWTQLPEKFRDYKIDFTEKKFIDIYEKLKEEVSYGEKNSISILKSYIDVPFSYTNIELLLWINYYMKFDKNIFNIMTTNFLVTDKILKEISMECRKMIENRLNVNFK